MGLLSGFVKRRPEVYAAVDVGSHAIKGVIFEAPRPGKSPRVLKKAVVKFARSFRADKSGHMLREFLFSIVKSLERMPGKITIGLGPHTSEQTLACWKTAKPKIAAAGDLKRHFQNLFETNRDPGRTLIAYPLELLVNDYPLARLLAGIPKDGRDWRGRLSGAEEITFRTMLLYLPDEIGEDLLGTRESLGGMPIEFVPRLAAYREAAVGALKMSDLFLVEVGGEETTLALIKDKTLVRFGVFPLGSRHFFRRVAHHFNLSFDASEDLKRQYSQGHLGEPKKSQLRELMQKEAVEWEKLFGEELKTFYPVGPIPPEVALTGEGARLPEIAAILKSSGWFGEFSYADDPKVRVLEAESVFAGDTLGGSLREAQEFALASLVFYALHHEPMF